jgi:hypothetical protein
MLQAVSARPDPWAGMKLFNTDIQALYSISIVVFGFNCHANVVSVSSATSEEQLLLLLCTMALDAGWSTSNRGTTVKVARKSL